MYLSRDEPHAGVELYCRVHLLIARRAKERRLVTKKGRVMGAEVGDGCVRLVTQIRRVVAGSQALSSEDGCLSERHEGEKERFGKEHRGGVVMYVSMYVRSRV